MCIRQNNCRLSCLYWKNLCRTACWLLWSVSRDFIVNCNQFTEFGEMEWAHYCFYYQIGLGVIKSSSSHCLIWYFSPLDLDLERWCHYRHTTNVTHFLFFKNHIKAENIMRNWFRFVRIIINHLTLQMKHVTNKAVVLFIVLWIAFSRPIAKCSPFWHKIFMRLVIL